MSAREADRETSDEALLAAHLAGDRPAFDRLVERYQRRVYAICLRYFGDQQDAEDAAQEAFVTLLRRGGTFAGRSSFSTWMYRVTMNACNDMARRRARRPRTGGPDVAELAEDLASAEDLLDARELRLELRAALTRLEPEQRSAIVLHDVYGLPYADIADRHGVAVGTVKSRIHRGHARLAEALEHLSSAQPSGSGSDVAERPERSAPDRPQTHSHE